MVLRTAVDKLDSLFSEVALNFCGEKGGLACFYFHAIKENNLFSPYLFPQENLSLSLLELFLEYFLEKDYVFISPKELHKKELSPEGKYGMLTFDDGYFNNTWCLELLKKYDVPAVFFITTHLIQANEKQWSDVIFYERWKRGVPEEKIKREIYQLISKRFSDIKDYITREFGIGSFAPQGDINRIMEESELKTFSENSLVHIGNHTHTHEPLGYLSSNDIARELTTSQEELKRITGKEPKIIAYPYGNVSKEVIEEVRSLGFKSGVTTHQQKNVIPISRDADLLLSRFNPVVSNGTFDYAGIRSPYSLKRTLKKLLF